MIEAGEVMSTQDIEESFEPGPIMLVPDQFSVVDADTANWVVRKVVEARTCVSRVETWAALEIRRAQNEERFFLDRYGRQLQEWVGRELETRGNRARSLKLPAGQVGYRSAPASYRTLEIGVLTDWCRRHLPEALRVKVEARGHAAAALRKLLADQAYEVEVEDTVIAAEVTKHIKGTGEVPAGLASVAAEDRFFIR